MGSGDGVHASLQHKQPLQIPQALALGIFLFHIYMLLDMEVMYCRLTVLSSVEILI